MTTINTNELKDMLKLGPVHFEYKKKDGSLREACGTLNPKFIPDKMIPSDTSTFKVTNLRYFDLDKDAWRSISSDTREVNVL